MGILGGAIALFCPLGYTYDNPGLKGSPPTDTRRPLIDTEIVTGASCVWGA